MLVDRFASSSRLGRLTYAAAQDQRCHADLVSMLENLFVFEAEPSAWRLQTGSDFPDIQPPLDLSFCLQPFAIPTPVDLSERCLYRAKSGMLGTKRHGSWLQTSRNTAYITQPTSQT